MYAATDAIGWGAQKWGDVGEFRKVKNKSYSCILHQLQRTDSTLRQTYQGWVTVIQSPNNKGLNTHLSCLVDGNGQILLMLERRTGHKQIRLAVWKEKDSWLSMDSPRLRAVTEGEIRELSRQITRSWWGDDSPGMNSFPGIKFHLKKCHLLCLLDKLRSV